MPAWSVAVPPATEMLSVPSPVMLLMATMYDVPEPLTPMVPLAVPVAFNVMSEGIRLLVPK